MMTRFWLMIGLLVLPFMAVTAQSVDLTPPEFGSFDPASVAAIDLQAYPVIPELTDHAIAIYERGQAAGRNAAMFSKVGDSMTYSDSFLTGFAGEDYSLGQWPMFQSLIDLVNANDESAFDRTNYATALGFSTVAALDPTWADADVCEPNETPLDCELRVSNSAFALVMFGTNDVLFFEPELFDFYLRTVILEIIADDVVPIMYTFPIRPEAPDLTVTFNQIIVQVAQDYDLPLINLAMALQDLPDRGVDLDDPLHLTEPALPNTVFTLNDEALQYGYTVRNFVTLTTLLGIYQDLDILEVEG